jgi:hypothetical protein
MITRSRAMADFNTATYVGLGRIQPADCYDGEDA